MPIIENRLNFLYGVFYERIFMINSKTRGCLKNKTAIIFGGTSGIGLAIASEFVANGAKVAVTSSSKNKIKTAVNFLEKEGNTYNDIVTCDVRSKSNIDAFVKQIKKDFGKIDIMVCCSGVHLKKPSLSVTEKEWDKVLDVNLKGVFLTNQAVGKYMVKQKSGCIINIASLGSYVALSDALPYCVSKSGVVMITKCLGTEWAKDNVRVNAIAPGVFPTPLNQKALSDKTRLNNIISKTPAKRLGKVQELAKTALFLAQEDTASFITGATFNVDGGFLASSGF